MAEPNLLIHFVVAIASVLIFLSVASDDLRRANDALDDRKVEWDREQRLEREAREAIERSTNQQADQPVTSPTE